MNNLESLKHRLKEKLEGNEILTERLYQFLKGMFDAGWQVGQKAGYDEGYETGKVEGFDAGWKDGFYQGYETGKEDEYNVSKKGGQ